ncbi:MAG: antibiotic biosynthesis monooxygenase family protein [Alphaproteobacteria bacterium]
MNQLKPQLAETPPPPYYAVIFTNQLGAQVDGYATTANRMVELADGQPGFLGVETVRGEDDFGITVSYWKNLETIEAWKANAEHLEAQRLGKDTWYRAFSVRIAKVERDYRNGS